MRGTPESAAKELPPASWSLKSISIGPLQGAMRMWLRAQSLRCFVMLTAIHVLLVGYSAARDEPKAVDDAQFVTLTDLPYAKIKDAELKLDMMLPKGEKGPIPAVVVIHGGGWRAGNKRDCRIIMPDFVRRGYAAVSPQYRFCPKDPFPAQVEDVKAAVRWVKSHAKEYHIDPERVGAIGFSAGGHLAMMLGLTSPADGLEGATPAGAPDSRVKAVVNFFGPTDLAASDIPEISKPLVTDLLGGAAADKPDLASKASPLSYVSKDDAPVLTFQGTKDPLVPPTQATKLAQAMTEAGVPGRVELLIGAQHGWSGAELQRTKDETFAFFDQYLKAGTAK
jgi:acetyl esterase/lipase